MQQCMELTGTNRSRAYPKNSTHQSDVKLRCLVRILWRGPERQTQICFVSSFQGLNLDLFGGNGGGVPLVPIPNTTVKPSSADGTWTEGSWESRTLPSKRRKSTTVDRWCSFCVCFVLDRSRKLQKCSYFRRNHEIFGESLQKCSYFSQ